MIVVLISLLSAVCVSNFPPSSWGNDGAVTVFPLIRGTAQGTTLLNTKLNDDLLIEPGKRIGRLNLGDTRECALQLFPLKPNVDQEEGSEEGECGNEYLWVDLENTQKGNIFIRFQNSIVFQIESATTRFHTAEGIKAYDFPKEVRRNYRGLRAYALVGHSPDALGGKPLIFWIDWAKGIAFLFASTRRDHQRYLYSIIVFKPGGRFCPQGESTDSQDWHELAPYSLELARGADRRSKR